jgi:hypothetical protein
MFAVKTRPASIFMCWIVVIEKAGSENFLPLPFSSRVDIFELQRQQGENGV